MARKQVLVQFTDDLLKKLDQLSEQLQRSRSSVIRDAVEIYVEKESLAEKQRRDIEGYTRFPETEEELAWARESGRRMVEEEPW